MKRIVKIPLEEFINLLIDIYEKGADFVDIMGVVEEEEETLRIEVKREYMREGFLTDGDIEDLENFV